MSENVNYFWTRELDNGHKVVGLSDVGIEELGKINFIDTPEVGTEIKVNDSFVSVEAEKAVSDLPSPIAGQVIKVNESFENDLSELNSANAEERWIAEIQ